MNSTISQARISHGRPSHRPAPSGAVAILVVASLFGATLTGCGSKSTTGTSGSPSTTSPTQVPDAAKIVAESSKHTETMHSVHVAYHTEGLPKALVDNLNADVKDVPGGGKAMAVGNTMYRADPNAPFVDTQFVVTDKIFYAKNPDGSYTSKGPADKIYDPGVLLDDHIGLANVVGKVQNPKAVGKETINGVATVKISGTIDASVIDKIAPTLGEGGGTLPITVWIFDVGSPPSATLTTSLPSEAPSPGGYSGPDPVRVAANRDQSSIDMTLSEWEKSFDVPSPTPVR